MGFDKFFRHTTFASFAEKIIKSHAEASGQHIKQKCFCAGKFRRQKHFFYARARHKFRVFQGIIKAEWRWENDVE